jgi:hypothetical protein
MKPFTMAAIAEAGLPVKSGAGQDRAGSSRTGLAGNDALEHHGSPVEQLASQPGARRPRTPPKTGLDQDEQRGMSSNPQEQQPPSCELGDICPRSVLVLFRRADGSRITRPMPCGGKCCEVCGPKERARLAELWAHAIGGDRVNWWVGTDEEWKRQRRRKVDGRPILKGHEVGHIPAPDGMRAVVTTADLGERTRNLPELLAKTFAAQPNDGRRWYLSPGWRQVVDDAEQDAQAQREEWTYEGVVGRSADHVEIAARELGVLVARTGDVVVIKPMDLLTKNRFFARIRLRRVRVPDDEEAMAA